MQDEERGGREIAHPVPACALPGRRALVGLLLANPAVLDTVSLPTILLGDFNDVPGSRTISRWAPTFAALAKPHGARFTFLSTGLEKEIDHIMVPPVSAWEGRDARVVIDPVTSDHRAVVGRIRLVHPTIRRPGGATAVPGP